MQKDSRIADGWQKDSKRTEGYQKDIRISEGKILYINLIDHIHQMKLTQIVQQCCTLHRLFVSTLTALPCILTSLSELLLDGSFLQARKKFHRRSQTEFPGAFEIVDFQRIFCRQWVLGVA